MATPIRPQMAQRHPNGRIYYHYGICTCCCCWNYKNVVQDGLTCERRPPEEGNLCSGLVCPRLDDHIASKQPKKNPRAAEVGTQYAFTLTLPPKFTPVKPLLMVAKYIMENGLTNKPYEKATKFAYVLEHTDKGTPHIHGVYETASGRRIASKYFQRYHLMKEFVKTTEDPHFWNEKIKLGHGHRGGYHQKARHNESYNAYLEKEGTVTKFSPPIVSNGSAQTPDEESSPPPSP